MIQKIRLAVFAILPALLLFTLLWLFHPVQEVDAQAGISNFDNVIVRDNLIVGDDGVFGGNLSVSGILAAASYITDTGDVSIPGSLTTLDDLISGDDLVVTDDALVGGNLIVSGTTTLVGATGVQGDLTVSGDTIVTSEFLRKSATQAVTNGGTITPTASVMLLTSSGAVTPTLLVTGTAGSQVTLIQTSNQDIILTEAGNRVMAGAVTLGQYDNITFYSDGTRWIEIGRVNN